MPAPTEWPLQDPRLGPVLVAGQGLRGLLRPRRDEPLGAADGRGAAPPDLRGPEPPVAGAGRRVARRRAAAAALADARSCNGYLRAARARAGPDARRPVLLTKRFDSGVGQRDYLA